MIVIDMLVYGVRFFNVWPAMMTLIFAFLTVSGRRLQDWVIVYYQGLSPRGDRRTNAVPLARRRDLLTLLEKTLWALWVVLLASALAFPIGGNTHLSDAFNIAMMILVILAIPIRVFTAAVLFWPGSQG